MIVRSDEEGEVVELTGNGDRQTLRLAEILARTVPGVLDGRVVAGRDRP